MVLVPRMARRLRKPLKSAADSALNSALNSANSAKPARSAAPNKSVSPAAKTQLQRGWELTGYQDTVLVPVLEKLFNDSKLYELPVHTFNFGQSLRKQYVTPETPINPAELRGAHAVFVQGMMMYRFLNTCKSRYRFANNLGTLYYFPPWHPVAQARFSRPSLVILRNQGEECNGKVPLFKSRSGRSLVPFDYAVFRNLANRRVRRSLSEAWTTVPVIDGLYVMQLSKVPKPSMRLEFKAALEALAKSDLGWAARSSSKFNFKFLELQLKRLRHKPVVWRLKPSDWSTGN